MLNLNLLFANTFPFNIQEVEILRKNLIVIEGPSEITFDIDFQYFFLLTKLINLFVGDLTLTLENFK